VLDGQQLLGDRISAIEEGKVRRAPDPQVDQARPAMAIYPALPGSAPHLPSPPLTGDIGAADKLPAPPTGAMAPPARPAPPSKRPSARSVRSSQPVVPQAPVMPRRFKKDRTIYLPPGFMKARLLTGSTLWPVGTRPATPNRSSPGFRRPPCCPMK
jgi:conjugal transfer pilus assembly protein TraB